MSAIKPAHLRQRTNRKAGSGLIEAPIRPRVLQIPNPDGREWHPLTVRSWQHAWASPMASQWLDTDVDAMGRLALLWDEFNKGDTKAMPEIRLQEQRFGLSPLDRSRLQWEVNRADRPGAKNLLGRPRRCRHMTSAPDQRIVLVGRQDLTIG